MRRIKTLICLILIILFLAPNFAYAWSPVTHYHISKEAYPNLFQDEDEQEIFCLNGTAPDMICNYRIRVSATDVEDSSVYDVDEVWVKVLSE